MFLHTKWVTASGSKTGITTQEHYSVDNINIDGFAPSCLIICYQCESICIDETDQTLGIKSTTLNEPIATKCTPVCHQHHVWPLDENREGSQCTEPKYEDICFNIIQSQIFSEGCTRCDFFLRALWLWVAANRWSEKGGKWSLKPHMFHTVAFLKHAYFWRSKKTSGEYKHF